MADIGSKSIGTLNVHKVFRGYQKTFRTIHPGDLTAFTVTASVDALPLTVVKGVYDSVTKTTTIQYTLSAAQSAQLAVGKHDWSMILTENAIPVPYLEGFFDVEDL